MKLTPSNLVRGFYAVALMSLVVLPAWAVRTAEEQAAFTPQEVLDRLVEGNKRFQEGKGHERDYLAEAEATVRGQFPLAVVVSCLDSRVPVEVVFDQGIGDIFVGRVAGNVEDKDMVGSLEFATKVAGAKLIFVLGHEACGAVRGAIADVELGNLTQLLAKIRPAMEKVKEFDGPRTAENSKFVDAVAEANVVRTIADIRNMSPLITELEKSGAIKIVGGIYSLKNGSISLIYPEKS